MPPCSLGEVACSPSSPQSEALAAPPRNVGPGHLRGAEGDLDLGRKVPAPGPTAAGAAIVGPPHAAPATEADLLALPGQGRGYELIDGELVEKQAGFRHSRAQFRLRQPLAPYDRRSGGGDRPGGWWFLTEQLVRFASGQTLRPDVAGWLRERLPEPPEDEETVVHVRPDWIGEIISPSNAANDLVKKRRIYHHHGVPHHWIIDPRDEILTVLRRTADGYVGVLSALRGERVRPEPFAAVEWLVGVLFGDDDDAPT